MTGALWYLLRTSGWNRLKRQATRLRNPRYAIAFALGIGYFWFFLFRPGQGEHPRADLMQNPLLMVAVPLFFILAIGRAWVFGSDRLALAFTQSEAALIFLFVGRAVLRNDLRGDLLHLSLLKTLPLRARDPVLAQILSSATAMAAAQILLVLLAGASLSMSELAAKIPSGVLVGTMVGAPALLLSMNAANFTLHNGAAVLFRGRVRLGDSTPGGVESMGQMMMVALATVLALILLLLLPLAAGAIVALFLRQVLSVAITAGALVAAAALAAEVYLLILGLARAYERVEPTQTV